MKTNETPRPFDDSNPPAEITFKAVVISILVVLLLAASNVYLALKVGSTISASIPAAIFAIGILRCFKKSSILESNIIQTAASAGEGVACAVAFILPALIILHFWTDFPYLETVMVTALGGLLGVLFSVPLRRVLLNLPALRFPEGTAVGNVLLTSADSKTGSDSMKLLGRGGLISALLGICQVGFKLVSDNLQLWFVTGKTVLGMGFGFSIAPLAAGYIIGFEVGLSLLLGLFIGWVVLIPWMAMHFGLASAGGSTPYEQVMSLWNHHLRYVGVGVMLVGGVWTLLSLLKPVINGLRESFKMASKMKLDASRSPNAQGIPRTERDISNRWVIFGSLALVLCIFVYELHYLQKLHIEGSFAFLTLVAFFSIVYIVVIGFLLATICGYFTGLIGSTNNPLSGILIISVMLLSSLFLVVFGIHHGAVAFQHEVHNLIVIVLIISTVMATVASISNENIQDLKAGYMVGATPWKQQIMLCLGVVVSSLIVGPVLQLLFHAYGMGGVMPHPGMDPSQMLAAPQAGLMAMVAQAVLTRQLEWSMIFLGCAIAFALIILDEIAKRYHKRVAILAVGLSIYLPPEVMTPIIIGTIVSYFVKSYLNRHHGADSPLHHSLYHRGILLCCGLVAGGAIMGVILAIPFVVVGNSNALALVSPHFVPAANVLGVLGVLSICFWIYWTGTRPSSKSLPSE